MNDKLAILYRESQHELFEENERLYAAIGDFLSKFLPWLTQQPKSTLQSIDYAMRGELDYLIDCNNRGQDVQ